MSALPKLGDERYTLDEQPGALWIDHKVFAEGGPSSFYDESAKDFVTVPGAWVRVRRFGPFASRDAATAHMVGLLDDPMRDLEAGAEAFWGWIRDRLTVEECEAVELAGVHQDDWKGAAEACIRAARGERDCRPFTTFPDLPRDESVAA